MTEYELSILMRCVAALGFGVVSVMLWRARRDNGPVLNAFAWAWITSTLAMYWYVTASLLYWQGVTGWLPVMWRRSWMAWSPCAGAAWWLVWVLWRGRRR